MPEIKIKVRDKCAEGEGVIICNNSDYAVVWDLDGEWTPYGTKTMRVNLADGTYQDVVFTGDNAALPVLTASGWVSVGLYAGDIHTTRAARLLALSSVLTPGGAPADPAEDVYAQIMAKLNELSTVSPEDIAKAVADYLAAHPIKDIQSAAINDSGHLILTLTDGTTLDAGVAKGAQGEKGATGPAGPQGPAGAPGKDGSDATVTAENIAGALGYTPAAPGDIPVVPAAEIRANTAARHSHKNKAVIDGITGQVTADKVKAPDHTTDLVQYGAFQIAAQLIIEQIPTVPTALKNPHALTIKIGSTIVTYDGSSAETVEIADGTEVSY